jgi:hypothetical protein
MRGAGADKVLLPARAAVPDPPLTRGRFPKNVASRACFGCARASCLPAPGPCVSRTSCLRVALDLPSRTGRESGEAEALLQPDLKFAASQ